MIIALLAVAAGIVAVGVAADQFVLGSARLARLLGVPAVIVGIVLVGFGTSLPEMLVSALAAGEGEPAAAMGNVVGSNIANISLLLGIGALLSPMAVPSSVVTREIPLVIVAAVVLVITTIDGLSALEGVALLLMMAAVIGWLLRAAARDRADPLAAETDELLDGSPTRRRVGLELGRAALGLAFTVLGSQLLLQGALSLAEIFGLRSGVVGVTLLAVGTSLPELVTVVQAARRREHDLIVGNLLGSNLFNSFAVAGLVGVLGGSSADPDVTVGVVAGLALTVLAAIVLITGRRVTRGEGALLFATYGMTLAAVL